MPFSSQPPSLVVACCFIFLFFHPGESGGAAGQVSTSTQQDLQLGTTPYSRLHALLEKTFLRIDVLTLDICLDPGTAAQIGDVFRLAPVGDAKAAERFIADQVSLLVPESENAAITMSFLRSVSLDQLLDGIRGAQARAVDAGIISDSVFQAIQIELPKWYDFLADRRVQKGDQIVYDILPDGVRSRYLGVDGDVLLDRVAFGKESRTSVIGTYFAPGGSFREQLIKSLESQDGVCPSL